MSDTVAASPPWYRSLDRSQWNILLAANLGWLFDGFELYALFLTVGPAMRALLDPVQYPQIPAYIGTVVAITLLGWGIGGIVGGLLADYIGRKRTMIFAILAYSITTGLTAISFDWVSFAILRFLVGIAIGSEWATGSSMMAELWPDDARGRGAGLMQCGIGIGNFLASFVWLYVGAMGPESWRYLYLVGVLPALLTLWIRTSIPESGKWEEINERRKAARARQRSGAAMAPEDRALTRFTAVDLFSDPEIRRRTIIALLLSLTTTLAWWGISSWLPPYAASLAAAVGRLCRDGLQFWRRPWVHLPRLSRRLGRAAADRNAVLCHGLRHDPRAVPVDRRFAPPAAGCRDQCVLHVGPILVDARVAARTVSHPVARHRHCFRLQCPALHCISRAIVCRHADRAVRWIRQGCNDIRLHLLPWFRGGAVPAGDERKAAAGKRMISVSARARVMRVQREREESRWRTRRAQCPGTARSTGHSGRRCWRPTSAGCSTAM